ncbi:Hypothetical protein NTJ_05110 [Nesidiocoris tenuis]|uniref:Uncharacterized protein n=1 Tax=Nesidiocoris tenuis TaxID=355587 RepID=A0ABN7APH7_9HEMI|nr:Hypothetical protein NTJ_05110 [Nesidiocoris tenuis]
MRRSIFKGFRPVHVRKLDRSSEGKLNIHHGFRDSQLGSPSFHSNQVHLSDGPSARRGGRLRDKLISRYVVLAAGKEAKSPPVEKGSRATRASSNDSTAPDRLYSDR